MKGDFSRDAFDRSRHYDAVLLEQGGLITDADWHEQVDVDRHRRDRAIGDVVGHCGAPLDAAAFALAATARLHALTLDEASPARLWVAVEDGYLLRSDDQGTSWAVVDTGTIVRLNALQFRGGTAWAVGARGTVLRSTDPGATWQPVDAGTSVELRSLAVVDAAHAWAAGDGGVVTLTSDGGANWERVRIAPVRIDAIAFRDALNGIAVGAAGSIHTTADGGQSWQERTSGTSAHLRAVAFADASHAWAAGDAGAVLHSADGGASWSVQSSGTTEDLAALDLASTTTAAVVGAAGVVLVTNDGGTTWNALATGSTASLRGVSLGAAEALVATSEGELLRVPLGGGAATTQALPRVGLSIGAGRYYVDGVLCEVEERCSYFDQPDRRPTARLAAGQHLVYVHVWRRHLSALEAEGIREVALGDADPSSRAKVVWQVRTLPLPVASPGDWTCSSDVPGWDELTAPTRARLQARAEPQQQAASLCDVGATAGYRRLENQLYRVEVQQGGGQPSFKWSRENGSVAFAIESIAAPSGTSPITTVVRLRSRGRDETLDLAAGDRVEILNDDLALEERVGPVFEIVGDGDDAMEVVLAGAVPADLASDPTRHPLLRRWEQRPSAAGAMPIVEDTWIELEDGVQIRFAAGGDYRPGDYWTVPARTITGDVDWPRDASGAPLARAPDGVVDRACRLGIVEVDAGGTIDVPHDCRDLFPPLTALTNLHYLGGDGQEVAPNPLNPVNVPLPAPLLVGVFNGQFPVAGAPVLFTATQGLLPNGTANQVVTTGPDGVAAIAWSLDPFVRHQSASAQLLVGGAPAPDRYAVIRFGARLSVAERVAYDPANCADLKALGVNTVQGAIDALCAREHAGGVGCCVTVGKNGEFQELSTALAKLIERGERRICICLLPGVHELGDSIDLQRPDLRLAIHGSGRTSRLEIAPGQEFNFVDLDALSLAEFDLVARAPDGAAIRLIRCAELQLADLRIAGMSRPGNSLVQIEGAVRIDVTASHVAAFQRGGIERGRGVLDRVPSLRALGDALDPDADPDARDGMFAPVSVAIAERFAGMTAAQRRKLGREIDQLLAQNDPDFVLSRAERETLTTLKRRLSDPESAAMRVGLDALRAAVLVSRPGFALSLADAHADTLLADNRIDGRLSLYGEATGDEELKQLVGMISEVGKLVSAGRVELLPARGTLRLRNNHLQQVRLGDKLMDRLRRFAGGDPGPVEDCFRSLIAECNTLHQPHSMLLAMDLSLSQNVLAVDSDVAATIDTQMKCYGNFARNDFRLFNAGCKAEHVLNGALNVVDLP